MHRTVFFRPFPVFSTVLKKHASEWASWVGTTDGDKKNYVTSHGIMAFAFFLVLPSSA